MSATLDSSQAGRWRLDGDLDFDSVPALVSQSRAAFDNRSDLEVDLGEVRRSNSAGLALLIEWMRWSAQAGTAIHFVRIPDSLKRLAGIGGVELPENTGA